MRKPLVRKCCNAIIGIIFLFSVLSYAESQASSEPVLTADFDGNINLVYRDPPDKQADISTDGFSFVEGISGKAIHFTGKPELRIPGDGIISEKEGSILFWVKPLYDSNDDKSHSFFEQSLEQESGDIQFWDVRDQDWGKHRFFASYSPGAHKIGPGFVLSNQWTHVAVTWKIGEINFYRIYINGLLLRHDSPNNQLSKSTGEILIGGNEEYPADAIIDQLKIYDTAITQEKINDMYCNENPNCETHQYAWANCSTNKKLKNDNGNLIEARLLLDEGAKFINDIDDTVNKLKQANFNVYVPCIWHGGPAKWSSTIEEMDQDFKNKSESLKKDPFAELIDKAHQNGIEVHPWFCVSLKRTDAHPELIDTGTPSGYYNVFIPEFESFITSMIKEVVEQYEVDGINLDFVRSGGVCTSDLCIEDYKQKTGRNLEEDSIDNKEHQMYLEWQAERMNEIIESISITAKKIKPDLIISVDSFYVAPDQMHNQGRNHRIWLEKGWIDLALMMDYSQRIDVEAMESENIVLPEKKGVFPLIANYDWQESGETGSRLSCYFTPLIDLTIRTWPGVSAVYLMNTLNETQSTALKQGHFSEASDIDWNKILHAPIPPSNLTGIKIKK